MARRTAAQSEALRERIVDEALRQFADRGVAATSVTDIAAAVGISKQALMHRFKSKSALQEAIRHRVKATLDDLLPHYVAAFTATDTQLDVVLHDMVAVLENNFDLARYLMRRIAFDPDPDVPAAGAAIASLLVAYVRRGQDEGALRSDFDPEDTVFVLGMMFLMTHAASEHRGALNGDVPMDELRIRRSREIVRVARLALLPPRPLTA